MVNYNKCNAHPMVFLPVVVSHVAPGLHQHAGIQQGSTRLRKPPEGTGVRLHVTEPNQWLEWENPSKLMVRMGKSLKNGG